MGSSSMINTGSGGIDPSNARPFASYAGGQPQGGGDAIYQQSGAPVLTRPSAEAAARCRPSCHMQCLSLILRDCRRLWSAEQLWHAGPDARLKVWSRGNCQLALASTVTHEERYGHAWQHRCDDVSR